MQNINIKYLQKELHTIKNVTLQMQDNRMLERERKVTSLEEGKEMLRKANVKTKSALEAKEEVILTEWKDVLLRDTKNGSFQ
jgi:hypothetical protein